MTNLDLLQLPEGEYKITDGNYHHVLKKVVDSRKTRKKSIQYFYIIQAQFGNQIWLKPNKENYHVEIWMLTSDFHFGGEKDFSKYEIIRDVVKTV